MYLWLADQLELWLNLSATKIQNSWRRPKSYVKSGTLCGCDKTSEKINLQEAKWIRAHDFRDISLWSFAFKVSGL